MKFALAIQPAVMAAVLLTVAPLQAADALLRADCTVDGKQADIRLDKAGKGRVVVKAGDDGYACGLMLAGVEGPPFSDNATGMLVLDLAKDACEPAAAKRRLQRTLALHMADPRTPGAEAMAVIERRSGVFQCKVGPLDLNGLKSLLAPAG